MKATELLAMYERVADAPDAVGKLRRFVLDLAVRGKLVEQRARDDGARLLGVASADAPTMDEAFAVPRGWRWLFVSDVATTRLGKMLDKSKNKGAPRRYLRNINVRWFDFDLSDLAEMRFEDSELSEFELRLGDVLICEGGEPGRAAVWDERVHGVYFQKAIHRVRFDSTVIPSFFVLSLKASANDGRLAEYFTGTGIKHFTGKGLQSYRFPCPSIAEQHRIVAKVDELMALCDQLEAARTEREAARDRLAAASFARLNAPEPDEFQSDARLALKVLPALSTRPDQVKQLRQTILNLAVRGKLVPQDSVRRDSVTHRHTGLGAVPPRAKEEGFELPLGWRWATLSQLGTLRGGGTPSKTRPDFWDGTIPWVSPKDMKRDYLSAAQMSVTESALTGSAVNLIPAGSVLFVVRGMILAHSFPVGLATVPLTINQDMKALVLDAPEQAEYLLRALKGMKPFMLRRVQRSSHGTCRLEGSDYSEFSVPIPPIAEQHLIVAKVDELMTLCDELEASLTAGEMSRSRLLDALLHEALDPPAIAAA